MKQNVTKQLCLYLAAYECLIALYALELVEYKILKHAHLM